MTIGEVETGIPIPPRAITLRRRGLADRLRRLEVGQSVVVQRDSTNGIHGYWKHLWPQDYSARKVGEGQVRIWRTA